MERDASLDDYRRAVRAYPELAAAASPPPFPENVPAEDASEDDGGAPGGGPFPGTYQIVERIAETHLSRTWKAWDRERKIHVVIKEPRARLLVDRTAEERFRREVQLASRLMHPRIVPILATHLSEPPWFFTMPLVEGEHLDVYCRDRQLSIAQRLVLFRSVCDAVTHAHQHGVIHRDLKPNNILVSHDGEPVLLDFGLGRLVEADGVPRPATGGRLLGSPGYMAPEQARLLPVDTRTDVYALGVILYEMLTQQRPIPYSAELDEMLRRICETVPSSPRRWNPSLSRDLSAIVLKSLAKDPAQRYQSVADLVRDIDNCASNRPVDARRRTTDYVFRKWFRRNRSRVAAGAVGLIALGVLLVSVGVSREVEAHREIERHVRAVLMGRLQTVRDDPANASALLWREFLEYDTTRTRYALWELYRRYPCILSVPTAPQRDVEYTPSGTWLVTVAEDGQLGVYDARTGRCSDTLRAGDLCARCVKCFPSGDRVVVGNADGTVSVFAFLDEPGRIRRGPTARLNTAGNSVTALAVSPSGRWLVSSAETPAESSTTGAVDSHVQLWDAADGLALARSWVLPRERVSALAFSEDENTLAAASWQWPADDQTPDRGAALLWSIHANESPRQVATFAGPCRAVAFAAGEPHIFCGAGRLERVDLSSGERWILAEEGRRGARECKWGMRSVAVARGPSRGALAFASGDGCICFYDPRPDEVLPIHGFHAVVAANVDVAFAPTGGTVASVSADGLKLWRYPAASATTVAVAAERCGPYVTISASGGTVAMSGVTTEGSRQVFLWHPDASGGPPTECCRPTAAGPLELSEDGRWLALTRTGEGVSRLAIVDASSPDHEIAALADDLRIQPRPFWLHGEKCVLLLACADGTLRHWPAGSMPVNRVSQLDVVHRFDSGCTHIAMDERRQWLAAASEGPHARGSVALWRATGRPLERAFADAFDFQNEFATHAWTWNVSLVPDRDGDLRIATTGSSRQVSIWDPHSGRLIGTLEGHRDAVFSCGVLGENVLVTASRDSTVRVWDVRELEEVCVLYQGRHEQPAIAVSNGRVAIADGRIVSVADTREIERLIAGNRDYQKRRLRGD